MSRRIFWLEAAFILALLISNLITIYRLDRLEAAMPRLVATGCDGADGPLYAEEEDHLPFCNSIEEFQP